MDVDDITRLMDISSNDPLTVRDRTMLEVMYGAGCVIGAGRAEYRGF